jgi:uncharacterized phiE125 gp8 family phage protein
MAIKVIAAPAALLTLAELRLHLKLDTTEGVHADDTLVAALLSAAHEYCEHYTQRSFGSQTLELALDRFPYGAIALARGPVAAIESVKYIDTDLVEQTVAGADYALDDYSTPAWLMPAYGLEWPATGEVANAVKVRYVAGADALPGAVRAALLLIVGHLYEHREAVAPGNLASVPMGANSLLDTVRVYTL